MKRTSIILLTLSTMVPALFLGGFYTALCPSVNADESSIVIDSDHFPDKNFRKYVSSEIDKNSDGKLTDTERLAVKSIDVSDKEIHDFTGIAYFSNLEYLDCSMNKWDGVDSYLDLDNNEYSQFKKYITSYSSQVLDVSQNTSLKHLNCNGILLKNLDVSKNMSLESLNCRNNALTELDVSHNTNLKCLDCSNNISSTDLGFPIPDHNFNQITTLNLCESADLSYLDISGNLLASVDVSAFPSLEYLDCSCCGGLSGSSISAFSSLDVSMNKALMHLGISYTSIESFDASELDALEYLECKGSSLKDLTINSNSALKYLDVSDTALTALDISGLDALEYLDCSGLMLQNLILGNNSALKHLDVSSTSLTALDVSELNALEFLDSAYSKIENLSFSNKNASLKFLDISNTCLQDVDILDLTALEVLNCSRSKLSTINISKNPLLKNTVERGRYEYSQLAKIKQYSFEDCWLCFSETTELINLVPFDPQFFPDDNFRKYVSDNIDTNGNGLLDDDERLSVESIDVEGQAITDLSGIEYFVNLSKLNCSDNRIKELRLNLPRLYVLLCHDNPISQLSIGACLDLKDFLQEYPLTINGNKKTSSHSFSGLNYQFSVDSTVNVDVIGGIEVSKQNFPDSYFREYITQNHDKDHDLVLSAEEISNLHFINFNIVPPEYDFMGAFPVQKVESLEGIEFLSFLESLNCNGTSIKSLDISRNYNLKYLYCTYRHLTALDISRNKLLRILDCGGNELTSLDLSNNSELSSLICSKNLLTELDLSNCPKLDYLICSGNDIPELDLQFCPLLENIVIQNTKKHYSYTQTYEEYGGYNVSCYVYGTVMMDTLSDVVSIPENTILKLTNCAVKFDANGGSGVMEGMTVVKGTSITLPKNQFTAPAGKVFDKWSVGKTGEKYQVMSTVTVSAVWKNAPVTPTVTKKPTAVPTGSDTPTPTPSKTTTLTPTITVTPTKSPTTVPTKAPGGKPTTVPGQPTNKPETPTPTIKPAGPTQTPLVEKEPSIADFVERLYTIALNRASEKAGKDFWVNEIISGNRTGGDCAHFFLIEAPEFLNRGLSDDDFVETLYCTFFDRDSEAAGKSFWVGELKSKRMTRQDVIGGFIDSKEWCNVCATYGVRSGAPTAKAEFASKNAIAFATRLYTCCLGREPEQGGLNYWSLALTNLEQTGCSAAKFFFTGDEFVGFRLKNDEYVRRLYTTFMGRDPESSEIAYWVGEIAKGTQSKASVMQFFGSSEEFTNICKTYGIERGEI